MDHGDLLLFIQRLNQISRPLNTKREQKTIIINTSNLFWQGRYFTVEKSCLLRSTFLC